MKKQIDMRQLLKEDIEDKSMRIWINVFLFIGVFGLAISIFILGMMIVNSNQMNTYDITVAVIWLISSLVLCFMGCCALWMENIALNIRQTNLLLKYQNGIISNEAANDDMKTDEEN